MREKNPSMEFANKTALAYSAVCKPLCQELGLPQTAFDILLFLANNPTYKTASDIVEVRHIKANLVSVNVDKLVHEGLLTRCQVPNDRRKTSPFCQAFFTFFSIVFSMSFKEPITAPVLLKMPPIPSEHPTAPQTPALLDTPEFLPPWA